MMREKYSKQGDSIDTFDISITLRSNLTAAVDSFHREDILWSLLIENRLRYKVLNSGISRKVFKTDDFDSYISGSTSQQKNLLVIPNSNEWTLIYVYSFL